MLDTGDTAPDFELSGTEGGDIDTYSLSQYTDANRPVLLTFYSFDFNPICTEGMCALRDTNWFSFVDDLAILGISGDGVYAHRRFAEEHDFSFPLLSDTDRAVARDYGIVAERAAGMRNVIQRSVFVVDADRTVRYAVGVDADDPGDVDMEPVLEAVQSIA